MDISSLYAQLEQKKREITTWEFTMNRAKGEVERLNKEIERLSSALATKITAAETSKVNS